jgi:hypothetical protein
MKGKDANLVAKYEKEIQNLKDVASKNQQLVSQVTEFKEKYKVEAKKNKELSDMNENLTLQLDEHKGINASL